MYTYNDLREQGYTVHAGYYVAQYMTRSNKQFLCRCLIYACLPNVTKKSLRTVTRESATRVMRVVNRITNKVDIGLSREYIVREAVQALNDDASEHTLNVAAGHAIFLFGGPENARELIEYCTGGLLPPRRALLDRLDTWSVDHLNEGR